MEKTVDKKEPEKSATERHPSMREIDNNPDDLRDYLRHQQRLGVEWPDGAKYEQRPDRSWVAPNQFRYRGGVF